MGNLTDCKLIFITWMLAIAAIVSQLAEIAQAAG